MSREILGLDAVRVRFGGNVAVDGVSLAVAAGSILGLVGPNGAGKTTLFNAISGLVRVSAGRIVLHRDGGPVELTRVGAWRRPGLGIGRTFQDSRLIEHLPVIDQLCSGALCRGGGPLGAVLRGPRFLRREGELVDDAMAILDGLGIADRATTSIDVLSAPERRLVDLGRAMMSRPDILLLDEISAGMPPEDREMVTRYVRDAARSGTTVIFVEHDMAFVRRLADRVVVMAEGAVLADGEPGEVLRRADVLEAYIGPGAVETMK
jgi:ABC-type branched-subunit amino acid transport system ATPase component